MSKAFYKSSVVPKLLHQFHNNTRNVEIWQTTCIVTNFGKTTSVHCTTLINPSNAQLTGTSNFPYFPKGGPVPTETPKSMHKDWQPLGHVSQWGGMEVGGGMLYPVSVVDGLVHQLGGWRLHAECALKRFQKEDCCPVGTAVATTAPGELNRRYDYVVHTTPPFYRHDKDPESTLESCYRHAFKLAFCKSQRVATPLLGAGARGFPANEAIRIAAMASKEWLTETISENQTQETLAFGLLEPQLADDLARSLETKMESQ